MKNSQTLQDLVKSAKASQDEFNNTLIEIHKQSASLIATELTKIYTDELNGIKEQLSAELKKIRIVWITIALILGFFLGGIATILFQMF